MLDKSFEEQVREELAGLRIKPADSVWDNVSVQLNRKRKRRGLAWLYVVAICLSAGGWWLLEQQAYNLTTKGEFAFQENKETEKNEQPVQEVSGTGRLSEISVAVPAHQEKHLRTAVPQSVSVPRKLKHFAAMHAVQSRQEKGLTVQVSPIEQLATPHKTILQQEAELASTVQGKRDTLDAKILTQNLVVVNTVSVIQPNSVQQHLETLHEPISIGLKSDTTVSTLSLTQQQPTKKQNNWSFHVQANAGVSGIRQSFGKLFAFTPYDRVYSSGFGAASGLIGPPILQPTTKPGAKDAFAFGIAVQAKKTFGKQKNHAIGVSLGYDQFSVATRIGYEVSGTINFVNSSPIQNAFNRYYTIQDSADFHSRYHFLRAGLSYHRSLPLLKKHDLSVNVGGGLSWFLASNGLHVGEVANSNINTQYFFQNNTLFRKFQYDISVGASISLDKSRKLQVGPRVQYMLSRLSKQDGAVQHLLRPSIQLSYQFGFKK